METKKYIHRAISIWTNVCRFALALVFIFSGFVKANDPLGTCYKIEEYVLAFGLHDYVPEILPLFGSILLGVVEFTLGVFMFFGIRRKLTSILMLVFMSIMTPFTLYLAIANPVKDCGCFGDVLVLTNWETFWKNVVFLIAAVSVYKWPNVLVRIISKKSQWIVSLYAILYISAIAFYCVAYLPIFDFSLYRIGVNLPEATSIPEGEKSSNCEILYIMEKEGVRKEFTPDDYPDSTWTLVDTKLFIEDDGKMPLIQDFMINSFETGEDVTEQILSDEGYTFLLIAYKLEKADDGYIDLINEIYDYSVENGYAFYCLTSSLDEEIEEWRERTGAEYPYFDTDEMVLKTVVRSNPGLVLLKEGTIINKWSCRNLPDEYDLSDKLENLPLAHVSPQVVQNEFWRVVAWFAIPLFLFTMLDRTVVERLKKRK